jgi:hypothetical protein
VIRSVQKKVLTYRAESWWYRVGDTALPTRVSKRAHYEDDAIEVCVHKSSRDLLIGHQVRIKRMPPVPMVCGDYFVALLYLTDFYAEVQVVFINHFFRLVSVGTDEKNYLIVVRNGTVQVPNNTDVQHVDKLLMRGFDG